MYIYIYSYTHIYICVYIYIYNGSKVARTHSGSPKPQVLQPGQWPGFQGRASAPATAMGAMGAVTAPEISRDMLGGFFTCNQCNQTEISHETGDFNGVHHEILGFLLSNFTLWLKMSRFMHEISYGTSSFHWSGSLLSWYPILSINLPSPILSHPFPSIPIFRRPPKLHCPLNGTAACAQSRGAAHARLRSSQLQHAARGTSGDPSWAPRGAAATAETWWQRNGLQCGKSTIWLFNSSPWYRWPIEIDGLPIKNGDFPWLC